MINKNFIAYGAAFRKYAFLLGTVPALLTCFPPLYGAESKSITVDQQISNAVTQKLMPVIQQEAQMRYGKKIEVALNLSMPQNVAQSAPCPRAPVVTPPERGHVNLNRLQVEVRCEAPQAWNTLVMVKPEVLIPVVVAERTLERGETVDREALQLKTINIAQQRGPWLRSISEAVGFTVKRRIAQGMPLMRGQLDLPVLIKRGQRITLIAKKAGVEAQTTGIAEQKGRKGDLISVKNERSARKVTATVTDAGVAVVMTPEGNE